MAIGRQASWIGSCPGKMLMGVHTYKSVCVYALSEVKNGFACMPAHNQQGVV